MVKIKWSDFLNPDKKIAINCQTEDDAEEFLQMLNARGVVWPSGRPITPNDPFHKYYKWAAYAIYRVVTTKGNTVKLCVRPQDEGVYRRDNYTVYRYSEVEFVDDDPEESAEPELSPKKDALTSIASAMAEICNNIRSSTELDAITTNSAAMNLLAEAFEIVSRTEI